MGSVLQNQPEQEEKREITVLVTGFGPFRAQYPINPSWEIARRLEPFLGPPSSGTRDGKGEGEEKGDGVVDSDTKTDSGNPENPENQPEETTSKPKFPKVRILVHPSPVHVGYQAVRRLIPRLWDPPSTTFPVPEPSSSTDASGSNGGKERKIDYMIHVGMAGGRNFYSIERRGHRDGYDMKDVDGRFVEGWADDWVRGREPDELKTDINIDKVWGLWRKAEGMENQDLRISEDAGRYLCDFIYYTSLNYLWKENEDKRVLFLHVPVDSDDKAIKKGVRILEELIRAMVLVGEKGKRGREV